MRWIVCLVLFYAVLLGLARPPADAQQSVDPGFVGASADTEVPVCTVFSWPMPAASGSVICFKKRDARLTLWCAGDLALASALHIDPCPGVLTR